MKKGLNPKLDVGDRIILVHMDGEDVGPGTKGEVIKIEKIPSFGSSVDYQYRVNWFDDGGKVISTLSLLPDIDGWLLDEEKKDIQEINFKSLDDLIAKGDFLACFSKRDLDEVYKFLELERQIGSHNMAMEGGKFLLMGPDYIRDFFKLQSYHRKPDEDKEILIDKLVDRAQDIYDLFVRASIKYLENKDKEITIPAVQRTMGRLATTAKQFWMFGGDKFLNKEIE
jgi:hypothetical protein